MVTEKGLGYSDFCERSCEPGSRYTGSGGAELYRCRVDGCRCALLNLPPVRCVVVATPATDGGRSAVSDWRRGLSRGHQRGGSVSPVRRLRRWWHPRRDPRGRVVDDPSPVAVNVNGGHALERVNVTQSPVIAARGDTGPIDQLGSLLWPITPVYRPPDEMDYSIIGFFLELELVEVVSLEFGLTIVTIALWLFDGTLGIGTMVRFGRRYRSGSE